MMNKKLLVIVPYRNREEHLQQFIPLITEKLEKQNIDYKIVVIEQDNKELFNRGCLINIGFHLFAKEFDYVCFHDVDMIGENFDYSYCDTITHISSLAKDRNYVEWYKNYLGGVTLFPKSDFISINGFSNEYWGWGCEDDDLKTRCDIMGIKTERKLCKYYSLEHESIGEHLSISDRIQKIPGYKNNLERLQHLLTNKNTTTISNDGLSNVNQYFTIKNIIEYDQYTLVQINLKKYHISDSIFIFSSVGSHLSNEYKNAVFKSWELDRFNSGCVSFNDSDDFPYSKYFKTIIHKSGFKFPNFFYFDDLFKITDNYEYICILDDDLLFKEPNSIIETISKMKDFNISVCSLSNNNKGKTASYGIMCADNTRTIKITNFCEMGCMILHNNFLKLVKQEYFKNYPLLTDFGFDWFICSLANNTNHIIGIIQYLSFFNPVQPNRNIGHNDWVNYKNFIEYIHPVIRRTIDVTN